MTKSAIWSLGDNLIITSPHTYRSKPLLIGLKNQGVKLVREWRTGLNDMFQIPCIKTSLPWGHDQEL